MTVNCATVAVERKEERGFGLSWIKVETLLPFSCQSIVINLDGLCYLLKTEIVTMSIVSVATHRLG